MGVLLGQKKGKDDTKDKDTVPEKQSNHVICKLKARASKQKLDPLIEDQFQSGRLLACIASRPGQSGRCDGYVLEGDELQFYKRKLEKKKKAWVRPGLSVEVRTCHEVLRSSAATK